MRTGLTTLLRPGTCKECGCTEMAACVDPETGDGCTWTDDSETMCTVCAVLLFVQWRQSWKPATDPMITALYPLSMAIAIAADSHERGCLVRVCARCVDPEFRAWLTANGLPNVSHGYCDPCLEAELARFEAKKEVAA